MKNLILFLSFILLSSCSYLASHHAEEQEFEKLINQEVKQCVHNQETLTPTLISNDEQAISDFYQFLSQMKSRATLSSVDTLVMWALKQMSLMPHLVSPTSRSQIFIKSKGNVDYFDYKAKDDTEKDIHPFIFSLSEILRKYKSQYTLRQLANFLNRYSPKRVTINRHYHQFLKTYQKDFLASEDLKATVFRGDEVVKPGEKINKLNYVSVIQQSNLSKQKEHVSVNSSLFPNQHLECTFDHEEYNQSVFSIEPRLPESHQFAFIDHNIQAFFVVGQKITSPEPWKQTILVKGKSHYRMMEACLSQNTLILSTFSRDPAQLLQQFIKRLESEKAIEAQQKGRYLFLSNPMRLSFEADRSSQEKLRQLLMQELPIYYLPSIGNIQYYDLEKHELIGDPRNQAGYYCGNR